ncbi:MAG: CRISPR-associated protein Cas4 [Halanaerobiales bacterium]
MITLNVTDIKQYMYCRRIIYFTYCQPVKKKNTYKMKFGKEQHDIVDRLEKRRTLKRYGLDKGEKIFRYKVYSHKLGLSGRLDMLVKTDREYIPIEMKYSRNSPGLNHKYQLAAYMLLLEETEKKGIRKGLIHTIPDKRTYVYKNDDSLREKVVEIIDKIRDMISQERFPGGPRGWKKCKDCEYKKFCGDV